MEPRRGLWSCVLAIFSRHLHKCKTPGSSTVGTPGIFHIEPGQHQRRSKGPDCSILHTSHIPRILSEINAGNILQGLESDYNLSTSCWLENCLHRFGTFAPVMAEEEDIFTNEPLSNGDYLISDSHFDRVAPFEGRSDSPVYSERISGGGCHSNNHSFSHLSELSLELGVSTPEPPPYSELPDDPPPPYSESMVPPTEQQQVANNAHLIHGGRSGNIFRFSSFEMKSDAVLY